MPHIDIALEAIPEGRPIRVDDGVNGIVVLREGNHVTAFEDVCPHAQWRLSDGELAHGVLECPGHAWEFSPATGRCLTVPAYCLTPVPITRSAQGIRLHVGADEPVPLSVVNVSGPARL